jgi:hypothetical protein
VAEYLDFPLRNDELNSAVSGARVSGAEQVSYA